MDVGLVTFRVDGSRCDIAITAPATTFGRHTDCDIQIPNASISRRHFQIQVQDEAIKIKDLGSANGTFLNEQRITESAVAAGDKIRIADVYFTVVVNGRPEEIARQHPAVEDPDSPDQTVPVDNPGAAPSAAGGVPAQLEEPPDDALSTDPLDALAEMGKPPGK